MSARLSPSPLFSESAFSATAIASRGEAPQAGGRALVGSALHAPGAFRRKTRAATRAMLKMKRWRSANSLVTGSSEIATRRLQGPLAVKLGHTPLPPSHRPEAAFISATLSTASCEALTPQKQIPAFNEDHTEIIRMRSIDLYAEYNLISEAIVSVRGLTSSRGGLAPALQQPSARLRQTCAAAKARSPPAEHCRPPPERCRRRVGRGR